MNMCGIEYVDVVDGDLACAEMGGDGYTTSRGQIGTKRASIYDTIYESIEARNRRWDCEQDMLTGVINLTEPI